MGKKALLLSNLGSPDSPTVKDVRIYLNEFLMDEKVIDLPYFLRYLLVRGIISPIRAKTSAQKYRSIWTDEGSPLICLTERLSRLVEESSQLPVYMCMRYANPTPTAAIDLIEKEHPDLEELILFPMFPHFAMSSYETGVQHVKRAYESKERKYILRVVPPYYNNEAYIECLCVSIEPFLEDDYDMLLFSYHGIPERHLRKSDTTGSHCIVVDNCCETHSKAHSVCYRHQVIKTTELVVKKLNIPEGKYGFSFQSRLGPDSWLKPFTAQRLKELPGEGVKRLVVVTPAFVSDCLETLEEIQEEGKKVFMKAGGESFMAIPCLNIRQDWVEAIDVIKNTAV